MMTDIIIEITIGFLLYVISLKSSQIQSERVKFSKCFGGACPQTLLVLACFACMCASHTVAMCVCIVSKSQEHVNYLGPVIKIGLVMPLTTCYPYLISLLFTMIYWYHDSEKCEKTSHVTTNMAIILCILKYVQCTNETV